MASEVDYINLALISLGETRISNRTEDNERARKANEIFDLKRDELLAMHLWNFATDRANLGLLTSAPLYKYTNQFQLPSDYIRMVSINGQDTERISYAVEGSKLLTDEGEAKIEYIKRVTDAGSWSVAFGMAFSAYLAFELAYPLTQSNSYTENMYKLFIAKFNAAKSIDGQSGEKTKIRQSDIFIQRGRDIYDGLSTGSH